MKKLLAIILSLAMLICALPLSALTASAASYSGTCGANLTWSLGIYTGILTISGSGDMTDYEVAMGWGDVPWYEYEYCSYIKEVVISDGVTSIGDCAFYDCTNLTSITIPDSVTSIGHYAFYDCTNLTEITIPDGVTSIGVQAFFECTNLTSITIPDSVISISMSAFSDTAYYEDSNNWISNVLYIDNHLIKAHKSGNYTIKDGTKTIAFGAFSGCTSLTSITIPDGVTSIGDSAFRGCTNLTEITIPDSVTYIGEEAFSGTAYYEDSNNWIDDGLYINNHLIEAKVTISDRYVVKYGTKTIAARAFFSAIALLRL